MDSIMILLVSLLALLFLPTSVKSFSDYNTLVYQNCASQTFTNPSSTLSTFFQELVAHSSQSKFFKTTEGDNQIAISGFFQCRGDISEEQCYSCVNTLPEMSNTLCSLAVAARIQLFGCYTFYEADGFPGVGAGTGGNTSAGNNLLHKTCGESQAVGGGGGVVGFVELRDAGFAALESCVISGNGFCKTNYDSVQVMAQCQGDLGACGCGKCVSDAVQIAQTECGSSVSGEIYLDKCFISYTNSQDGIHPDKQKGNSKNNGKTIAIVVGGGAALIVGVIFLLFIRSRARKADYY